MSNRLDPKDRKQQILAAAMTLAAQPGGWGILTRDAVAMQAQCSPGLISQYFGTMISFRRDIMRLAVRTLNYSIIAQGVSCGDRHAMKADDDVKRTAVLSTLTPA